MLNRAVRDMCLSVKEIEAVMSLPVFAVLPQAAVPRADVLAPSGDLGRQLQALAGQLL